jgi:hypothetical protein
MEKRLVLRSSVSHAGSCTAHEVKDYGYYGKKEKDVDEES